MTITIYITLLVIMFISGLLAVSPFENDKKQKEETIVERIGIPNTAEIKKQLYSKIISLVVFISSLASLMAMYFIK